jgi:hypothetical protein
MAVVMATYWLATPVRHPVVRWTTAALAIAFLVPNIGLADGSGGSMFHASLHQPRFFTSGLYRRYLQRGETVVPVPYGPNGMSLMWQAESRMYFRMASGLFGYAPADYLQDPAVGPLLGGSPAPGMAPALKRFLVRKGVGDVIIDASKPGAWPSVLSRLGLQPTAVGGVLLYRVPSGWSPNRARS